MKITRHRLLPFLLLTALGGLAASAWAQPAPRERPAPVQAPDVLPPRNPASLSDSVRRAQRETGGQVLGAERVQYDGREINRVKVMDDRGRVRYMDDDPQRSRDATERARTLSPRDDASRPRQRGERPPKP
ncbi:hypothetical protein DT603_06200 [Pseudoxanthomonas gei]|uniref:PepSY domain-containing protein n=1 Tax=Pseudoxanthomonas gei TaxID=1383030 RepID=A0ABX0AC18_9GAMM|nr:hypothetical protein [Pseudoxanthomonas gei]